MTKSSNKDSRELPVTQMESVGLGIYSIPEATRLTGVRAGSIRRWLKGYSFKSSGVRRQSPAVWSGQHAPMGDDFALGFLDLQEVRFVNKFRRLGVSWKTIREVSHRAEELFGTRYPFCTQRFKTDGRELFLDVLEGNKDETVIEVLRKQRFFKSVITPYLRGLEFKDLHPIRWWPLGHSKSVVLDPKRRFGKPIVKNEGVPTSVLAKTYEVEGSVEAVSYWYRVSRTAVKDAIEYERRLSA